MNKIKHKNLLIIISILALASIIYLLFSVFAERTSQSLETNTRAATSSGNIINEDITATSSAEIIKNFVPPLDNPQERIIKKTFGLHITPKTSPVRPERFTGYHTGVDFEIFPDEENIDVPVRAVCSGKLLLKKIASGYGGVAVQECVYNKETITVIYGHLKLSSINKKVNDNISIGEEIGILGKGFSTETDGERKHLHLGIHKGSDINIKGYVNRKEELSGWLDPCLYLCK